MRGGSGTHSRLGVAHGQGRGTFISAPRPRADAGRGARAGDVDGASPSSFPGPRRAHAALLSLPARLSLSQRFWWVNVTRKGVSHALDGSREAV